MTALLDVIETRALWPTQSWQATLVGPPRPEVDSRTVRLMNTLARQSSKARGIIAAH